MLGRNSHFVPSRDYWRLPNFLAFEDAKKAAKYVKGTTLTHAGFPDINVAIREWTTTLLGRGPKLPFLDPLVDPVTEFCHPFTFTLSLAIAASEKNPTARARLDFTCVVAKTVTMSWLSQLPMSSALPLKAYEDATIAIMSRIGTLHEIYGSLQNKIRRLSRFQGSQGSGGGDVEVVATLLLEAEKEAKKTKRDIESLDRMHTNVTKRMTSLKLQ
ncbi:hypothetical protein CPB84DRAFT_1849385 [Gymnopilus junonius]|uniref:Uncharacterized protein n=1 Tax=Gymnopilus junonius TaxID=109634 RepID=A0A9P5TKN2_GYMJU|nr:hypothetical protein CPB84DRAFT_1849385 [Gymnopilus junonius]